MKKIAKKIGCSLLALGGLVSLTGCNYSKISLTEEQINNLITVADNADKFMNETLNLLEGENEKIDIEQAYKLFDLARTKFDLNYDGIRDNVILEAHNPNYTFRTYYYKDSVGQKYYFQTRTNALLKLHYL